MDTPFELSQAQRYLIQELSVVEDYESIEVVIRHYVETGELSPNFGEAEYLQFVVRKNEALTPKGVEKARELGIIETAPAPVKHAPAPKNKAATALPQWKPRQPKSWADVTIFEHEHEDKIRVRVGAGKSCVVTAGDLGMVDARTKGTNEAFRFLRRLLSIQSHAIDPKTFNTTPAGLRQKVRRLKTAMRSAFGIDAPAVENSQTVARRYRKQQPNEPTPQDMQGGQYFIAFRLESDSTR